jgi:hypothetical protein
MVNVYLTLDKILFTNVVLLLNLYLFMIIVLISLQEMVKLLRNNVLSYQNVNIMKMLPINGVS